MGVASYTEAMSAIHAGSIINAARPPSSGGTVTLTGDGNTAFAFGEDSNAYHIANSDGTFDEKDNNSSNTQIHSSTDWIIPNASAPGSYRIRHTTNTGDTGASWWFPAGLINTYLALTSNRTYRVRDNTVSAGGKSVTYTLEIDDGSVSQDTGSYTLTADREDF
jgi:hypothetical protein